MTPYGKRLLLSVLLCGSILTACGQRSAPESSGSGSAGTAAPEASPAPETPAATPGPLGIKDLPAVLAALDPAEGTLTWFDGTGEEESYPAGKAICGASYAEELRGYTWETCLPYPAWREEEGSLRRYQYAAPGVTLTAFQSVGSGQQHPVRVVTEEGEGWFTLPYVEDSAPDVPDGQTGWDLWDTLGHWHGEARAALRYGGTGKGEPLTAEELEWFRDYTASTTLTYDDEWGGWIGGATPISCFFTSRYDDPRDMDAGEFMYYFPGEEDQKPVDEAEFQLVQKKLNWLGGDGQLLTLAEMPVPCHRNSRSYVNEILTRYAGVTVEEMHTDWLSELLYIPETDCFYGFASDFGPGFFVARYGEKEGDMVTLWEDSGDYDGGPDVLKLQKAGERWQILSHQRAE